MRVVPGGGARDVASHLHLLLVVSTSLSRDNTPQKVARREQLRLQRSQGTDVETPISRL